MNDGRRPVRLYVRMLDPEQRLAGLGALGIIVSLFTPWWRDPRTPDLSHAAINRFTWIELALLLVAGAVLLLLLRRAQGRVFHLPLSDGTLATGAGLWCCVLLFARILDPPSAHLSNGTSANLHMRWGILFCFASAALLAYAGQRGRRRYHRGEPESVAADADAQPTVPLPR